MDEPTIGLDPSTRRGLWDLISGVNREFGITVLLTSHYIEEADALCSKISIIDHGKFVASGTPEDLKSRVRADMVELQTDEELTEATLRGLPGVTEVRTQGKTWILRTPSSADLLPVLFTRLRPDKIRSLNVVRPSLEAVFIDLTGKRIEDEAPLHDYRKFYASIRRARQ